MQSFVSIRISTVAMLLALYRKQTHTECWRRRGKSNEHCMQIPYTGHQSGVCAKKPGIPAVSVVYEPTCKALAYIRVFVVVESRAFLYNVILKAFILLVLSIHMKGKLAFNIYWMQINISVIGRLQFTVRSNRFIIGLS